MAVKSIVDIELAGGDKFERFAALFAKYEAALAKTPAAWGKVGKEQAHLAQQAARMTASMLAQNQLHHELATEQAKQNLALEKSQRVWTSIGHTAKSLASTVGHITLSLLKWGSLLGGAGGLLSIYGIGRGISEVVGERRSAMGLGLSIGQQSAFGINFSRLLDTGQYLSWVAGAEQDVTKQAPFYSLLGHGLSGNTEKDAMSMLMAIRRLARTTPLNMLGPEFSALGINMSPQDIRRLASMGNSEFQNLVSGNRADVRRLGMNDRTAKAWQDFITQMERATTQIRNTFVVALGPLAGPLKNLSAGIVHVLQVATGKHGLITEGINNLASWLNKFNGKITKPEFLKGVEQFTSDVGTMAQAVHFLAKEVSLYAGWRHPGHEIATAVKGLFHSGISPYSMLSGGKGITPGPRGGYIGGEGRYGGTADKLDSIFGLPAGTMRRLVRTESGFNPNAVSARGAQGLGQLMPDTAWSYGLRGNDVFDPVKNLSVSAEYLSSLVHKFGGSMEKALAAYNWGPKNVQNDIAKHGNNWLSYAPRETRDYVLRIENATGGSAVVASAGLGAP